MADNQKAKAAASQKKLRNSLASPRGPGGHGQRLAPERSLLAQALIHLGHTVTDRLWRLGFAAHFFVAVLLHSGTALRRFQLTFGRSISPVP